MIPQRLYLPWFAILAVGLVGCGTGSGLVKVRGTVTLDGQPLPNALVTFISKSGEGVTATGTTNAQGEFVMQTYKPGDGVKPGEYKVTVQYSESVADSAAMPALKEGQSMKDAFMAAQKVAEQNRNKRPKYVIPPKYSNPSMTILSQTVPTDGPVKLDLQSK